MGKAAYLNVDLEIDSRFDLTPIAEAFGEDVSVMYCGQWGKHYRAAFEAAGCFGANESIELFCVLVDALEGRAKELWDSSFSKTFDLGFESGDTAGSCGLVLDPGNVARIAEIGATLAVTVYPVSPELPSESEGESSG